MRQENYKKDAYRRLKQSLADMDASGGSLKNKNFKWYYSQAQQAAGKALESLYCFYDIGPWDHSLTRLLHDFPNNGVKEAIAGPLENASELDKLHIPTRHPNGLPDLIPSEASTEEEAKKQSIRHLEYSIKVKRTRDLNSSYFKICFLQHCIGKCLYIFKDCRPSLFTLWTSDASAFHLSTMIRFQKSRLGRFSPYPR